MAIGDLLVSQVYVCGTTIVDMPTAGCWHFDLSWGKNKTSVDLVYG